MHHSGQLAATSAVHKPRIDILLVAINLQSAYSLYCTSSRTPCIAHKAININTRLAETTRNMNFMKFLLVLLHYIRTAVALSLKQITKVIIAE